jgi:hypothetical protein
MGPLLHQFLLEEVPLLLEVLVLLPEGLHLAYDLFMHGLQVSVPLLVVLHLLVSGVEQFVEAADL